MDFHIQAAPFIQTLRVKAPKQPLKDKKLNSVLISFIPHQLHLLWKKRVFFPGMME